MKPKFFIDTSRTKRSQFFWNTAGFSFMPDQAATPAFLLVANTFLDVLDPAECWVQSFTWKMPQAEMKAVSPLDTQRLGWGNQDKKHPVWKVGAGLNRSSARSK